MCGLVDMYLKQAEHIGIVYAKISVRVGAVRSPDVLRLSQYFNRQKVPHTPRDR
jgi:hypothetical protein